ncbi:MAG: LysE family transporter, partial [Acidobacteriota bacterium]
NVAVMRAAERDGPRTAISTALGGGAADLAYATLATLGLARVLASRPEVVAVLRAVGGASLVGFGVALGRPRAVHVPRASGFPAGLAIVLANPAALITWSLVCGAIADAPALARWACVVGIGAGSTAWYVVVARASTRLGAHVQRVTRLACAVLVASGVAMIARACW